MLSTDSIWNRAGESGDDLANQYNAVIGATLLWGFGVNYVMVTQVPAGKVSQHQPPPSVSHRVFRGRLRGHCDVSKSDNPVVSLQTAT